MLLDGQEVGQDLGGMELVGQAVPHRHAGILCQFLYDALTVAAVLNAIEHSTQNPCGVGDGFLLADLGTGGIQVGGVHPQVVGGHLKGAAGAGGGFFEDQGDVLATKIIVADALFFLRLQLGGQVQQGLNLVRGEVQQFQKVSAFQVHHS